MFKLVLEKAETQRSNCQHPLNHWKSKRILEKTSTPVSLAMWKPLTVWITTNCGKFLEMGIPDHHTCLLRNLYAGQEATVRTRHGTTDWFQIGNCIKAIHCHPAYLTYMQSTSCEMPGWMRHKLESRLPGEISITLDTKWHHPYGRKWRRTKKPLGESERGERKSWFKLNIQKTKFMASGLITSWEIDGETGNSDRLNFFGLQNHCRRWLQPWN